MIIKNGGHQYDLHQPKESLLRHQNFVAKSEISSFEPGGPAWEASTLPLSYTRKNRS